MTSTETLARTRTAAAPDGPPLSVMILGAGGMLGRRLARRLAAEGRLGRQPVERLDLVDIEAPAAPEGGPESWRAAIDLSQRDALRGLAARRPDVIFNLAATVSGEAERDFTRGYRNNVIAAWALLDALRQVKHAPRLVFASSVAVYGPPLPELVPDGQALTPQSSYGTQKAMVEMLLADHSRKGLVDAMSLRLPTLAVRPGRANAAASGFVSAIIREPLAGQEAALPVPRDTRLWIASPDVAVADLMHAAALPAEARTRHRALATPGLSVTVAQIVSALSSLAGPEVAARIIDRPDDEVARIVTSWPQAIACGAARSLGFPADRGLSALIRAHMDAPEG